MHGPAVGKQMRQTSNYSDKLNRVASQVSEGQPLMQRNLSAWKVHSNNSQTDNISQDMSASDQVSYKQTHGNQYDHSSYSPFEQTRKSHKSPVTTMYQYNTNEPNTNSSITKNHFDKFRGSQLNP